MKKSVILFSCSLPLMGCAEINSSGTSSGKNTNKPNILLIYTDQQRYNTIHSLGNEHMITPNLDRLVNEGTAFTHSFVASPVCAASRWSLHSGMYTTSHETYSNHHWAERPETSLPLELKKQGYQTVLLGKNHSFLDSTDMDIIHGYSGRKRPEDFRTAVKPSPWKVEEDPMYILTNRALDILEESRGSNEKPVFLWLSYQYPHDPFACPEPYFSMYDTIDIPGPIVDKKGLKAAGKPFRQQFHQLNNNLIFSYDDQKTMRMKRNYYGMISLIDDQVGRILEYLEENDMRENTLIIFTSDHGDYMGDYGMYTKSPALYDCLVRVPLIFSWPGIIKKGQVTDELVSAVDLMPTILDFVDAQIPSQVQGESSVNKLTGSSLPSSRKYVFAEYGIPGKPILREELEEKIPDYQENPVIFNNNPRHAWEGNPISLAGRIRMIRSHDFKLVEEKNGTNELYDLKLDPNELVNVYNDPEYSAIREKFITELHEWKSTLPGIEKDFLPMAEQNLQDYLKDRAEWHSNN